MKRLIDFIASAIALVVFAPLFLVCYVAIRLEDGEPVIYRQERIGLHGKPFYIYKFRSMTHDAEKDGPQLLLDGALCDPRLTKTGKWMRAHHLDELPQLWNVLKGDMSIVGPRPERQYFIDKIMEHDSSYPLLFEMRPGLTSEATLYNGYTDTMQKMLKRLHMDIHYLEHRTLWTDISIVFKTVACIVSGKHF